MAALLKPQRLSSYIELPKSPVSEPRMQFSLKIESENRIIDSVTLEKTSKIIKSNHYPAKSTTKPRHHFYMSSEYLQKL